jgi:methyltransferase (TIGR00027 family)
MDEIIARCVREGAKTVFNLAAGLDARAFRLALPPSLCWFDVDLPEMIRYRREHLEGAKPVCVHEHLAADLSEADERRRVFARKPAGDGPALVITEGLLIYLTDAQVSALAQQLHETVNLRWWLIDLASPQLLQRMSKTWQPHLSAGNAPMQFAPADGTAFFAPFGWREAEFRSVWEESLRLGRSVPLSKLWNLLLKLRSKAGRESARRMSSIVLLERA